MILVSKLGRIRRFVFSLLHVRTLGSTVIAVDEEHKVVLVRNSYGPGQWRLPGGGVRRGENFRQAAIREAREEVGVDLDAEKEGAYVRLLSVYGNHMGNWQNHVAVWVLEGWNQIDSNSWEIDEIKRFGIDELPENTAPGHRRRIEEWAGRRQISDSW